MRAFFFYKIGTPCNSDASGKISNTKKKKKKEKKKEKGFLDLVYLSTNSLDPRENSNGYLWLF